jgi:hypothetical protein
MSYNNNNNNNWSTCVILNKGQGGLKYLFDNFQDYNLDKWIIRCHSLYSKHIFTSPVLFVCKNSVTVPTNNPQMAKTNVLLLTAFNQQHIATNISPCSAVLTNSGNSLTFEVWDGNNNILTQFEGYAHVELRYKSCDV